MRPTLLLTLLSACSVAPADDLNQDTNPVDDTQTEPTGEPGTQIGGIDCDDSTVEVSVLDAHGAHLDAELTWNPDGDDVTATRTCSSPCHLEVYGGLDVPYTFSATVAGMGTASATATLVQADLFSVGSEDCPEDLYSTTATIQFDAPDTDIAQGGDCADSNIYLSVVDGDGAHQTATVLWESEPGTTPLSRTCNSPCWLEIYAAPATYALSASTDAGLAGSTSVTVVQADKYGVASSDCGGMDLYETPATLVVVP